MRSPLSRRYAPSRVLWRAHLALPRSPGRIARASGALGYNAGVHSKRRPKLGQHFLASEGYRRRIIEALPLRPDDLVIEVGPGRGAMTALLAERASHVVAIEVDPALAGKLREQFQKQPQIEIIGADILSTDVAAVCRRHNAEKCFVFGNLPYYITSPILRHLMGEAAWIRGMACLVQREVADRITAQPGSRDYGYLSVFVQIHAEPKIVLKVPPGAFSPPPKVQSAFVDFKMRPRFPDWSAREQAQFIEFAQLCFAQKRKKLLNNLQKGYSRAVTLEVFEEAGLPQSIRAEELTVDQLARLYRTLSRRNSL